LGGLQQERIRRKIGEIDEDGGIDGPDGVASSWIVGAFASITLPNPHEVQKDDRLRQHVSGVTG